MKSKVQIYCICNSKKNSNYCWKYFITVVVVVLSDLFREMGAQKNSDAGQSRRRWVRPCSWWPQVVPEFSFRL